MIISVFIVVLEPACANHYDIRFPNFIIRTLFEVENQGMVGEKTLDQRWVNTISKSLGVKRQQQWQQHQHHKRFTHFHHIIYIRYCSILRCQWWWYWTQTRKRLYPTLAINVTKPSMVNCLDYFWWIIACWHIWWQFSLRILHIYPEQDWLLFSVFYTIRLDTP